MMLAIYLNGGVRIEGREEMFELEELGVRIRTYDSRKRRTGEWEFLPWAAVARVVRFKARGQR